MENATKPSEFMKQWGWTSGDFMDTYKPDVYYESDEETGEITLVGASTCMLGSMLATIEKGFQYSKVGYEAINPSPVKLGEVLDSDDARKLAASIADEYGMVLDVDWRYSNIQSSFCYPEDDDGKFNYSGEHLLSTYGMISDFSDYVIESTEDAIAVLEHAGL